MPLEQPARPSLIPRDFYEVLGVHRDATARQIVYAYRSLAKVWHPDLSITNKEQRARRFMEAHEAYMILSNPDSRALYDSIHETDLSHDLEPSPLELPPTGDTFNPDPSFPSTSRPVTPTPHSTARQDTQPSMAANLHGRSDFDQSTIRDAPPTADYIPPTPFTQYYNEHALAGQPPETPTTPVPPAAQTQNTDTLGDDSGIQTAEATPKAALTELPAQKAELLDPKPPVETKETKEAEDPPETPVTEKPADAAPGAPLPSQESQGDQETPQPELKVAEPSVDEAQKDITTPDPPVDDSQPASVPKPNAEPDPPVALPVADVPEPASEEGASGIPVASSENDAQDPTPPPETPVDAEITTNSSTDPKAEMRQHSADASDSQLIPPKELSSSPTNSAAQEPPEGAGSATPMMDDPASTVTPTSPIPGGLQAAEEASSQPTEATTNAQLSTATDENQQADTDTVTLSEPTEKASEPETSAPVTPLPETPVDQTLVPPTPAENEAATTPDASDDKADQKQDIVPPLDPTTQIGRDAQDSDSDDMQWDDDDDKTPSDMSTIDRDGDDFAPITPLTATPPVDEVEALKTDPLPADDLVDDAQTEIPTDQTNEFTAKDEEPVISQDPAELAAEEHPSPTDSKRAEESPASPSQAAQTAVAEDSSKSPEVSAPPQSPSMDPTLSTPLPDSPTASTEHDTRPEDPVPTTVPPTTIPVTETPTSPLKEAVEPETPLEKSNSELGPETHPLPSDIPQNSPVEPSHDEAPAQDSTPPPADQTSPADDDPPSPQQTAPESPAGAEKQEESGAETSGPAEEKVSSPMTATHEDATAMPSPVTPSQETEKADKNEDRNIEKEKTEDEGDGEKIEKASGEDGEDGESNNKADGKEPGEDEITRSVDEKKGDGEDIEKVDQKNEGIEKETVEKSGENEEQPQPQPQQEPEKQKSEGGDEEKETEMGDGPAGTLAVSDAPDANAADVTTATSGNADPHEATPPLTTPIQDQALQEERPGPTESDVATADAETKDVDETQTPLGIERPHGNDETGADREKVESGSDEVTPDVDAGQLAVHEGEPEQEPKEVEDATRGIGSEAEKAISDKDLPVPTTEVPTQANDDSVGGTQSNEAIETPVESAAAPAPEPSTTIDADLTADPLPEDTTDSLNVPPQPEEEQTPGDPTSEPTVAAPSDATPDAHEPSSADTPPDPPVDVASDTPKDPLPDISTTPSKPAPTSNPAETTTTSADDAPTDEEPAHSEAVAPTPDAPSTDTTVPPASFQTLSAAADPVPAPPEDNTPAPSSPAGTIRPSSPRAPLEPKESEASQGPQKEPETPATPTGPTQKSHPTEQQAPQPPPPNPEANTVPATPTDDGFRTIMPNTPIGPSFSARIPKSNVNPVNESVLATPYDQTPNPQTPADSDNEFSRGPADSNNRARRKERLQTRRSESHDGAATPAPSTATGELGTMKNGKTISSPPSIPPITASNGAVPAEWHYPLHVSLDTLYTGAKLRYRVTRYLLTGQTQESYVDIEVKPGWRKGTKIRFAGLGNERAPPQPPQDVIFIVDEIPHPRFRREGSNLYTTVDISLLDALSETRHVIQGLDGKDIIVDVDFAGGLIRPGDVTRIPGKGMPIRKNSQVVGQGDLTIRWNVVFPDSLSERQRRFIRMARDEDGDDRTS